MSLYDWTARAVCAEDPDLWQPSDTTGPWKADAEEAKEICRDRCPVREQCLAHALRIEAGRPGSARHGIAGGHGPRERADLDPTRTAAPAAA